MVTPVATDRILDVLDVSAPTLLNQKVALLLQNVTDLLVNNSLNVLDPRKSNLVHSCLVAEELFFSF